MPSISARIVDLRRLPAIKGFRGEDGHRGAAILPLLAMLNPQCGQRNAFAAREAG